MSMSTIISLALFGFGFVLVLIVKSYKKDLQKSKNEIEKLKAQIMVRKQELEVIRDVQANLNKVKEAKKPKKVETAVSGDSDARINRLNSVQNSNTK